jgi:hypothetical protein
VPLIAVAPNKFATGVEDAETNWRVDGRTRAVYEVLELKDALERTYTTDAHLVSYVVRNADGQPLTHQPRINKGGIAWMRAQGFTVDQAVFFCDEDNPGHAPWSFALLDKAVRQYAELEVLQTAGIYHTEHGRRIVQPIAAPLHVEQVEPYLDRWLLELAAAGIRFDKACRDWTRHFRLPHVRRDGRPFRSPLVDVERMRAIELAPLPVARPEEVRGRAGPRAAASAIAFTEELPEVWREQAVLLGKTIREHVTERWHEMYLALGGALLRRGFSPERLPVLVAAIAVAAGSEKPQSHQESARGTARTYRAGLPCTGFGALRQGWPEVADALEEVTATGPEARLRAQAKASIVPVRTLAETVAALEETLRKAPQGLTVISAECGLGKTAAAIRVAGERARKSYATARATGARAPDQSKTAISVDKNALALEIVTELRSKGVPVKRIFGPLSLRRSDGTPECRYHHVAEPLVAGGQALQWILCEGRRREKCEYYETCKARRGFEGPVRARVAVGPHALIGQLDGFAGTTGLLVIDEPPPFLDTVAITKDDLAVTSREKMFFDGRYATALTPLFQAVRGWVQEHAEPELAVPFEALVRMGCNAVDADARGFACRAVGRKRGATVGDDAIACAKESYPPDLADLGGTAPPLSAHGITLAKGDVGYARRIGTASRVLGTLYRAITADTPVSGRVEVREGERILLLTMVRTGFDRALHREGSVVVTDANAKVHLPILAKAVGYKPVFEEFAAADGSPIERVLLRWRSATRKTWLTQRKVQLVAVLPAVRAAIDWAREDPATRSVGFITYKALREVLETAVGSPEAFAATCADHAVGQDDARSLVELLRGWDLRFGHYGAVRGLNTMSDVDAIITLGDPWPHVGEVRNEVAFLELAKPSDERLEELCRAELEQAHGRIRAVHRTRPGRALHVGSVLPSGAGWSSGKVEVRRVASGPSRKSSTLTTEQFRAKIELLGGAQLAANALACSRQSLHRYLTGERPVPPEIEQTLRDALSSVDRVAE